mmetsp:Transcript_116410/g.340538  ORF Transcript_116410/g.340538 Transcript_116410/m.340538 type:complete len:90 (+) Transcript_116410:61-330(+)
MSAPIVPGIMFLASTGALPRRAPEAVCQVGTEAQVEITGVSRCHRALGDGAVGRYICGFRGDKVAASGNMSDTSLNLTMPQGCGVATGI